MTSWRCSGAIVVEATAGLAALDQASTIIVPGWRDRTERPPDKLITAIARASERGARCLSICSGVFVLAAAGLLHGKRATTHWRHIPDLRRLHPQVRVEENMLYVDEGNVITSAGSAAGIDACLHLVRRDFGSQVANSVARRLVMPECYPQCFERLIAALHRDVVECAVGCLQQLLRAEHTLPLKPCDGCHADAFTKVAQERALAHGGVLSELVNLQRFGQAFSCPIQDLADDAAGPLPHRRYNVLRLAAITVR